MTKKIVLFSFLIFTIAINAQKPQRFGYIDMEYILENLPDYAEAQAKITAKSRQWENNIDKQAKEIEDLKANLRSEKVLLTKELIEEYEEDIQIKELELKKLKAAYFGVNGDLYFLRRQLVKPIQDLVYNAVQDIATKRKYDFILDKSTDLIMLYTNKQYDISDLVITSINRAKKTSAANEKRNKKGKETSAAPTRMVSEEAQKKIDARELKRAEMKRITDEKRAAQLKKREELLKANEEKRQQRIKEIEDAKNARNKTETVETKKVEETKKDTLNTKTDTITLPEKEITAKDAAAQEKADAKALKRAEMNKIIEEKRAAKLKKREELLKANEAKKLKRLQEIEDAKKAKENKNN